MILVRPAKSSIRLTTCDWASGRALSELAKFESVSGRGERITPAFFREVKGTIHRALDCLQLQRIPADRGAWHHHAAGPANIGRGLVFGSKRVENPGEPGGTRTRDPVLKGTCSTI